MGVLPEERFNKKSFAAAPVNITESELLAHANVLQSGQLVRRTYYDWVDDAECESMASGAEVAPKQLASDAEAAPKDSDTWSTDAVELEVVDEKKPSEWNQRLAQ